MCNSIYILIWIGGVIAGIGIGVILSIILSLFYIHLIFLPYYKTSDCKDDLFFKGIGPAIEILTKRTNKT